MLKYKHIEYDNIQKLICRVGNVLEQILISGFSNILEILDCLLMLFSVLLRKI